MTEDVRCIRLDSAVTRRIPDELRIGLDPYQFESALSRRAKRR